MRTSRATEYALLATAHIAENHKEGPILSQQISEEYKIPRDYLLKILKKLIKANILRSIRGPHGGFVLIRDVSKISLLEIIEAIEGPLVNQMYLSDLTNKKFSKNIKATCDKVFDMAIDIFAKTSLADVMR